jgi:hypothetical protein
MTRRGPVHIPGRALRSLKSMVKLPTRASFEGRAAVNACIVLHVCGCARVRGGFNCTLLLHGV